MSDIKKWSQIYDTPSPLPVSKEEERDFALEERERQKWFDSQFPAGFIPRMGEKLAFRAGRDSLTAELTALRTKLGEVERENARLCFILSGYKVIGTDGCKTCETGRVSMFVWNERCTMCDPKGYEPILISRPAQKGEE